MCANVSGFSNKEILFGIRLVVQPVGAVQDCKFVKQTKSQWCPCLVWFSEMGSKSSLRREGEVAITHVYTKHDLIIYFYLLMEECKIILVINK